MTLAAFLCNLDDCFLLFQWVVQYNKSWMGCAPLLLEHPNLRPRTGGSSLVSTAAHCLLSAPTACCLLPPAHCPLLTAHCSLSAALCCCTVIHCLHLTVLEDKAESLTLMQVVNTVCHENSCLDSEKIISNVDSILLLLDQAWS